MKKPTCDEILQMINQVIDGELHGDKLVEAEEFIRQNPECGAMFRTISRTIDLYRQRRQEVDSVHVPEIDWEALKQRLKK
ncbi:hypothetical protein JXA80_10300 [bacterium]|nr:hypothetical protein [candidate division CSSED10-310 bacterium]